MMKKISRLANIVFIILCATMLSSCQNPTPEPSIKFSSGSDELKAIYYLDRYNDEEKEIENQLKFHMVGKRFIDLPIVVFGNEIEIEALNFETDVMEIYDYIIDGHGNIISDYDIDPYEISMNGDNMFTYTLNEFKDNNMYADHAFEGKLARYILVRCKINKSTFAFATLILGGPEEIN